MGEANDHPRDHLETTFRRLEGDRAHLEHLISSVRRTQDALARLRRALIESGALLGNNHPN